MRILTHPKMTGCLSMETLSGLKLLANDVSLYSEPHSRESSETCVPGGYSGDDAVRPAWRLLSTASSTGTPSDCYIPTVPQTLFTVVTSNSNKTTKTTGKDQMDFDGKLLVCMLCWKRAFLDRNYCLWPWPLNPWSWMSEDQWTIFNCTHNDNNVLWNSPHCLFVIHHWHWFSSVRIWRLCYSAEHTKHQHSTYVTV